MNPFMIVLGLGGFVFSICQIRSAWQGRSGAPIGFLIGGALLGQLGAGIGSTAAADDAKKGKGPNIGGIIFYVILALFWGGMMSAGFGLGDVSDKSRQLAPQARPVFAWFQAVKAGDKAQLKTVFSQRMQTEHAKMGWDKVLKMYQDVFKKDFGDYKLDEFSFEFNGDDKKGEVLTVHNGKKLGELRVIKEGADWKVNERWVTFGSRLKLSILMRSGGITSDAKETTLCGSVSRGIDVQASQQ